VLVPGGFGQRGLEGKIKAAQHSLARPKCRTWVSAWDCRWRLLRRPAIAGSTNATTFELDPEAEDLIITTMADQIGKLQTGGTMRLGNYDCSLTPDSLAAKTYGATEIIERHRHRGECNNAYRGQFEAWGIRASGINPENNLVEVIEGLDHPYFLASQFHPEFKSRPNRAHPMFAGFVSSMLTQLQTKQK
jgi:CTP synthase